MTNTINIDPVAAASILAALVLANAGAMLAAYVSIRVQLAVLQNSLDTLKGYVKSLETDVNTFFAADRGDGKIRASRIP